jgi:DNA repair protein RAD5
LAFYLCFAYEVRFSLFAAAAFNPILRLRRAVLHPSLIASHDSKEKLDRDGEVNVDDLIARYMKEGAATNDSDNSVPTFAQLNVVALKNAEQECPICLEPMDPPVLAPRCMHST